jgi:hypothetical protein
MPLAIRNEDLRDLDLGSFPRADEFVVEASDNGSSQDPWTELRYVVPSWDLTVNFPWWDKSTAEMREWGLQDIPLGSIESPYWDWDQGWRLLIWEAGEEVFIMEGDGTDRDDEPPIYERWFAVPGRLYRSAWQTAIDGFRTTNG